jgi:hypothetical protein
MTVRVQMPSTDSEQKVILTGKPGSVQGSRGTGRPVSTAVLPVLKPAAAPLTNPQVNCWTLSETTSKA